MSVICSIASEMRTGERKGQCDSVDVSRVLISQECRRKTGKPQALTGLHLAASGQATPAGPACDAWQLEPDALCRSGTVSSGGSRWGQRSTTDRVDNEPGAMDAAGFGGTINQATGAGLGTTEQTFPPM